MIKVSLFELNTSPDYLGMDYRAISEIVKTWPKSKIPKML